MGQFLIRRLVLLPVVMLLASTAVFMIVRLIPGDPVDVILQEATLLRKDDEEALREQLGLNDPAAVAYGKWLGDLAQGNLGESLLSGRSVSGELEQAVPVSLELVIIGLLVSLTLGLTLGLAAAVGQNTIVDYVARLIGVFWLAAPGFWLATMFIVFSAKWFAWIPPITYVSIFEDPSENLQLFLPAGIIIGLHSSAVIMRVTRSGLLDVLRQDFIRTARSKGLAAGPTYLRHALPNALLPVITLAGIQFAVLIGGAVTTEVVFNVPGVGRLLVESIQSRDYPVIQGTVLFLAFIAVAMNLIVDVSYAFIDPRLRGR